MHLSDQQWDAIKDLFPKPRSGPGRPGRPAQPFRDVLDGILWVMSTGAPWHAMPRWFPAPSTCFGRFQQWSSDGTLRRILRRLRECVRCNDESFIDGSYVPAKRGGESVGKCRAGNATKIMALVDSEGLPLAVTLAAGNRHDVVLVEQTLDAAFVDDLPEKLVGDKAFDSAKLQEETLNERNLQLIAPTRGGERPSKRRQDRRALRRYKRRWKVEALFALLKQFRRIGTRWERKAGNYLGLVYLACIAIILRRCW